MQKIQDYINDVIGLHLTPDVVLPDVVVIAQNFDQDQIVRLLQLILCCAVNCDKKQTYISIITNLPYQVQCDVMATIQEFLSKDANQSTNIHTQSNLHGNNNHADSDSSNNNVQIITPVRAIRKSQVDYESSQIKSPFNRSNQSYTADSRNLPAGHRQDTMPDEVLADELRKVTHELEKANAFNDERAQACHELELKLKQLRLERDQLIMENERLSSDIKKGTMDHHEANTSRKSSTSASHAILSDTGKQESILTESLLLDIDDNQSTTMKISHLQNQIQALTDKLFKVESSKEDFRIKVNLLQEDLDVLNRRHEKMERIADHAKRLQDELDEQRHLTGKLEKCESMIENYIKKLSESKKNIKALEEKNIAHVKRNVELEDEIKRLSSINSQLDIYKRQIRDLQLKLGEESHRADKAEYEMTRLDEKYSLLKSENDRLIKDARQFSTARKSIEEEKALNISSELGSLTNDRVGLESTSKSTPNNIIDLNSETAEQDISSLSMTNVPNVVREKLVRLEHENQLLHKKFELDSQNNYTVLEALLDEANKRCSTLDDENRNIKRQVLLLEGRLRNMSGPSSNNSNSQIEGPRKMSDISSEYALQLKIEELQSIINMKDQELSRAEYRYKRNLQKAKQAVQALEQQTNNLNLSNLMQSSVSSSSSFIPSLEDCNILRQQVIDRDRRILDLEREFAEFKRLKEIHEQLILNVYSGQVRLERIIITQMFFHG